MTVDHHRDVQTLAEIVEDDCRRSGIGAAVTGPHGAGFVQQKTHRKFRDLVGKIVLVEDLAVSTVQRVGIKPTAHKKPGLLSAAPAVLELSNDALLELPGYRKQGSGDRIVLLNQRFIHARNTIDSYLNPAVDIPI